MPTAKKTLAPNKNLFLLTGENDVELKIFFRNWQKSALAKYGEYNVFHYDALEHESAEIIGAIHSPPFFGDGKRIFFIENFPPPNPSRPISEKKKTAFLTLAESLATIPEECVVVLVVGKPDKRGAAYKTIIKITENVREFPAWHTDFSGGLSREGATQAIEWIMTKVSEAGGKILPAAARFLLEYCGADPWKLFHEIQKLVMYTSTTGKPISEDDVEKLSIPTDEMANFAFSNAMQTADPETVLKVFEKLATGDAAPQAVFARDLVATFRQLIQVKALLASGSDAGQIGIHPFVVAKMTPVAKKFSMESLIVFHEKLLRIDIDSKTGRLPITAEKTDLFRLEVEKALIEFFGLHAASGKG